MKPSKLLKLVQPQHKEGLVSTQNIPQLSFQNRPPKVINNSQAAVVGDGGSLLTSQISNQIKS
jgi:hypothetical protein